MAITFHVSPIHPTCPNFLFALRDLSTMNTDDIATLVQHTWQDNTSADFLAGLVQECGENSCQKTIQAL
jgi:hypothetical protein